MNKESKNQSPKGDLMSFSPVKSVQTKCVLVKDHLKVKITSKGLSKNDFLDELDPLKEPCIKNPSNNLSVVSTSLKTSISNDIPNNSSSDTSSSGYVETNSECSSCKSKQLSSSTNKESQTKATTISCNDVEKQVFNFCVLPNRCELFLNSIFKLIY